MAFIPFPPGGTPAYMATEVVSSKYVTSAADIWSLGILAYELCMLELPFAHDDEITMHLKIGLASIPTIPIKTETCSIFSSLLIHHLFIL